MKTTIMVEKSSNISVLLYAIKNEVYFTSYRIIGEGVLVIKSMDGKTIGTKNIINTNYDSLSVPAQYNEVRVSVITGEGVIEKKLKINH